MKLFILVGLSSWTLNLTVTVLEDEFRVATIGRVATCAFVVPEILASPNTPRNAGM